MIYLDHAATTPVPRAVADTMYTVLTEHFGNPSAQYPMGLEMKKKVELWRRTVAKALGCESRQLFFTSCGTEGDNWAVRAAAEYGRRKGRHIITTAIEHAAVLEPVKVLAAQGYEVTYLKPDRSGHVSPDALRAALRPRARPRFSPSALRITPQRSLIVSPLRTVAGFIAPSFRRNRPNPAYFSGFP